MIRCGPARVLGALTAFAGVAVVSLRHEGEVSTYGIALGVATAICWSLGTIAVKRTASRVEPLWAVALPLVAGGALLAVAAAVTGTDGLDLTPRVGVGVVWTTLVGTALAWLLWMHLVTTGEVGRVAVSIFLVPVVAVVLGWAVLDEQLGWPLVGRHRAGVRGRLRGQPLAGRAQGPGAALLGLTACPRSPARRWPTWPRSPASTSPTTSSTTSPRS